MPIKSIFSAFILFYSAHYDLLCEAAICELHSGLVYYCYPSNQIPRRGSTPSFRKHVMSAIISRNWMTIEASSATSSDVFTDFATDLVAATESSSTIAIEGDDPPAWVILVIVVTVILIGGILIAVILVVGRRFLSRKVEIVEVFSVFFANNLLQFPIIKGGNALDQAELHRYVDLPRLSDEWEIERRFVGIEYTTQLGRGAFGSVYLGHLLAKNMPAGAGRSIIELSALKNAHDAVAVKMLHDSADAMTERDFRAEIETMKRIRYHDRLVNILACVTVNQPLLLIFEYCVNGDLLEFMRQRREYMLENNENFDEAKIITVTKQIMFAIQIAYGLGRKKKRIPLFDIILLNQEYISSRGFIHRDIAARNIMVDQQETCKIGDFGLCRAIGIEDENYHSQGGKLPLKWMSLEAIEKYHFSVASDVWSFGILLFEIVTLGGAPYVDWPAAELLTRLRKSERMAKPDNCSDSLFDLMSLCWAESPSQRPSFSKLRQCLGVLLEDVNQDDYYLKLNANANYYVLENNSS